MSASQTLTARSASPVTSRVPSGLNATPFTAPECARIVRPGGLVVVTTPNQLSLASKLHLVVNDEFLAFKEAPGLYPAHITALVETDLRRIARECGLVDIQFRYTDRGRIPLTAVSWPSRLGARGRWFSDNVVMVASRP